MRDESDADRLDQIMRDACGYWPPARAEILKLIETVRQEERERCAQIVEHQADECRGVYPLTATVLRALAGRIEKGDDRMDRRKHVRQILSVGSNSQTNSDSRTDNVNIEH